jgi:hypothetical protein
MVSESRVMTAKILGHTLRGMGTPHHLLFVAAYLFARRMEPAVGHELKKKRMLVCFDSNQDVIY